MMVKVAERRALAEAKDRAVEVLARATADLDRRAARVEELTNRPTITAMDRLLVALAVYRVGRVRVRGAALRARIEEIDRQEVELFEVSRREVGERWGIGTAPVASWGHLEAWEQWFVDLDERHELEIAAEERGEREEEWFARRRETDRQVDQYGIHDPARFLPDLDVPVWR